MAVPSWLVQSYCTFDSSQIAQALDWTYINLDGKDLEEAYGFALWYRPAMNRNNQLRVDRIGLKVQQQGGSKPVMMPPATMQGRPSAMGGWFGNLFGGDDSQAEVDRLSQQWEKEDAQFARAAQEFDAYGSGGYGSGGYGGGSASGGGGFNWGGLLTPLIQAGGQIGSAAIYAANVPQATPYMPANVVAPPNYYAPQGSPYAPQGQINPMTGQPYPMGTQINPMTGQPYPMGMQINPMTGQPYPVSSPVIMPTQTPQWLLPVGLAAAAGLIAYAVSR